MQYIVEKEIYDKVHQFLTSDDLPWIAVDYDGRVYAYEIEPLARIDFGRWYARGYPCEYLFSIGQQLPNWEVLCWHAPTCGEDAQGKAFEHAMKVLG